MKFVIFSIVLKYIFFKFCDKLSKVKLQLHHRLFRIIRDISDLEQQSKRGLIEELKSCLLHVPVETAECSASSMLIDSHVLEALNFRVELRNLVRT